MTYLRCTNDIRSMKVILEIPDPLLKSINDDAKKTDRTRASYIRNAIRHWLEVCSCGAAKKRGDLFCATCAAKNGAAYVD